MTNVELYVLLSKYCMLENELKAISISLASTEIKGC